MIDNDRFEKIAKGKFDTVKSILESLKNNDLFNRKDRSNRTNKNIDQYIAGYQDATDHMIRYFKDSDDAKYLFFEACGICLASHHYKNGARSAINSMKLVERQEIILDEIEAIADSINVKIVYCMDIIDKKCRECSCSHAIIDCLDEISVKIISWRNK
ncbi:hypothetical protein UFOVP1361_8 [uncultured Caudovirales phage]|uniref:Uncharacterized protein n=1 Tax=uncultured Caudovirales phage TaxID=2100421 RepID=A0A6J5S2M7_9CAUD|nr:hypothetical protein UFOVP1361_8 [uncultured Caudovirales phage]